MVVKGRCSDFKEGGEKGEDEDEVNETIKEKGGGGEMEAEMVGVL